ncbi:MAG: hypothetical protein AAF317_08655 [Pseudomonadota bacterium]
MKEMLEFIPPEVALALALWGGLSYFVTGKEMASRIGHADYVPACEMRLAGGLDRQFTERARSLDQITPEERAAPLLDRYSDTMFNDPGVAAIDQLLGGMLSGTIEMHRDTADAARQGRDAARARLEAERAATLANVSSVCACQVQEAWNASKVDWALFTGSLSLISQDGVKRFGELMQGAGHACQGRVLS